MFWQGVNYRKNTNFHQSTDLQFFLQISFKRIVANRQCGNGKSKHVVVFEPGPTGHVILGMHSTDSRL